MRLKNSFIFAGLLAVALGQQPVSAALHLNPFHHKNKAIPADDTPPAATDAPALQEQAPAAPADALTLYDDVGYAALGISGGISLAHATLPQSSFVEITNLDTGKTILAVVSGPMAAGRTLAMLSPQAMTMLGGASGVRVPVRIRRVNPPEQEQAALLAGRSASERLDTPPVLLNALKRKLAGVQGKSGMATGDEYLAFRSVPPPAKATKAPPHAKPVATRSSVLAPVVAADDSRFIVENEQGTSRYIATAPHRTNTIPPKPNAVAAVAPTGPHGTGSFFIQIAALSSESSAKAMAARLGKGASVQEAGQYWRVRLGPYANEEKAQAALGPLAAKGYHDARPTH